MFYTVGVQPVQENHKIEFTHNPGEPDASMLHNKLCGLGQNQHFNSSLHSFGDFLSI